MLRFLLVCLGGAAGTGARYLVAGWVPRVAGTAFPWATIGINALGSFLIALVMHVGLATNMNPTLRAALTVGVLGGFTTYSTFNYETLKLVQDGAWLYAGANLLGTVVVCLVAGVLGFAAGRAWVGS
jgi:fluoride exporter